MKLGYLSANTASGIRQDVLAVELEDRGFDSIWMPEHSHIPTSRITPYAGGTSELPNAYKHMMNPFVSLAMAASATTRLELYTGVCLVLEHDLLDLACTAATLDVISNGRFTLGVGPGWNAEEFANHRPTFPFRRRYAAMSERVAALRAAWAPDPVSFDGEFDSFSQSWINPKPLHGTIHVALSCAGPVGIEYSVTDADAWCPLDVSLKDRMGAFNPQRAVARFRSRLDDAGRDPDSVPVTVCAMEGITDEVLDACESAGVARVVAFPEAMDIHPTETTLDRLDRLQPILDRWAVFGN